jgi:hypothetical protein
MSVSSRTPTKSSKRHESEDVSTPVQPRKPKQVPGAPTKSSNGGSSSESEASTPIKMQGPRKAPGAPVKKVKPDLIDVPGVSVTMRKPILLRLIKQHSVTTKPTDHVLHDTLCDKVINSTARTCFLGKGTKDKPFGKAHVGCTPSTNSKRCDFIVSFDITEVADILKSGYAMLTTVCDDDGEVTNHCHSGVCPAIHESKYGETFLVSNTDKARAKAGEDAITKCPECK